MLQYIYFLTSNSLRFSSSIQLNPLCLVDRWRSLKNITMKKNKYSQKEIAESFSNGNFELTYQYLSQKITWNIIGEDVFQGKSGVVENCERTAEYLKSIQTDFRTEDIIATDNKVVIRGTGEFIRDGKRVNLITACDVYEFNDDNELETISSYCIPEKK